MLYRWWIFFMAIHFSLPGQSTMAGSDNLTARIVFNQGVPVLTLNDQPTIPFLFFFNTSTYRHEHFLTQQVELSKSHGFHLYSMPFVSWPWIEQDENGVEITPDFSKSSRILDRFIEVDPEARFLLRIWSSPPNAWKGWAKVPEKERTLYADGSSSLMSLGSEYLWKEFKDSFSRMVLHFDNSPYAPRILGYHIGGQNSTEWFPDQYREKGPDYSPVNLAAFRKWLRDKYTSEDQISRAWGKAALTFNQAEIPRFEGGRFPIRGIREGETLEAFYRQPEEQAWVDYSAFTSDLTASRIIDAAQLVKSLTGGRKLTTFFHGYVYDLPGSLGGHWNTMRLLNHPSIDILCAPFSYQTTEERLAGGSSGCMTAIDSVALHGKLWINEDDMRTHLIDVKHDLPKWLSEEGFGKQTRDLTETLACLQRNLANGLVHRMGTWWMDLIGAGAFNEAKLWETLELSWKPLYMNLLAHPTPYTPDVSFIVDEMSRIYIKNDWDITYNGLALLRNDIAKTGASTGYYYLEDFISGLSPRTKVYVFASVFYLSQEQIDRLLQRLDQEHSTAIWFYAPGFLGPEGISIERSRKITGIDLSVQDGPMGTRGEGILAGLTWGWNTDTKISPRLVVVDPAVEPLGRYMSDTALSAVRKQTGLHTTAFFGDFRANPEVLHALFSKAGVHLWAENGEIVHTDGNILFSQDHLKTSLQIMSD